MDNSVKMYSQVAAAAQVTDQQATIACYLLNLSRSGRSMAEATELLRMERADVRTHARSWSIPFADYKPGQPAVLTWTKEKRGSWLLVHAGKAIASAISDGKGTGYDAGIGGRREVYSGSSADVAIARASRALERDSLQLIGIDDVEIYGPANGEVKRLAPMDIGDRALLARVLHS